MRKLAFFARYGRFGGSRMVANPPGADPIHQVSDALSTTLPAWDDRMGTIFLDDDNGNLHAYAWDADGFAYAKNGVMVEQYPPTWSDPPHTPGTTYYVKNGGSDAADGLSDANAWATIAKVNGETFAAGDAILFNRGDTWNTNTDAPLTPPSGGTSGNYTKFGAYGTGAKPIFTGGGAATRTIELDGIDYVWIDSITSTNGGGLLGANSGLVNIQDANTVGIGKCLTNCEFINAGQAETGLFCGGDVESLWIKDCVITGNPGHGFRMAGSSAGGADDADDVIITGCTFSGNATTTRYSPENFNPSMISTGRIYNNTFTSTSSQDGDFLVYCGGHSSGPGLGTTWEGMFHDNICNGNGNNFAITGSKAHGNIIFRNKLFDTRILNDGDAISINSQFAAGPDISDCRTHHNVMYSSYIGLKEIQRDNPNSDSEPRINAWNNTFDDLVRAFNSDDGARVEVVFKNNLIGATSSAQYSIEQTLDARDFDYNYHENITGNVVNDAGTTRTWSGWQGVGQDANSDGGADPLFADDTNATLSLRDYRLAASSPARSKGTDAIPRVATDPNAWIGINYVPHATSPDCGAYQYLSGKTLNFSKYFLGVICSSGSCARFKLWSIARKTEVVRMSENAYSDSITITAWDPYLAPGRKGTTRPDLENGMSAFWRPRAIDSECSFIDVPKPITAVTINNNQFSHAMRQFAPDGSSSKTIGWNGRGASYNLTYPDFIIADGTTGHPDPTETNPSRDSLVSLLWYDGSQWIESEMFAFENINDTDAYQAQVHFTNVPGPNTPRTTAEIFYTEQGHLNEDSGTGNGLPKQFVAGANCAAWCQHLSKFELETPGFPIRHAIGINYSSNSTSANWRFPARGSDGTATGTVVPMGTLFCFPSTVDLDSLGLSEIGLRVARAIQRYGLYVVDVAPNHPTQPGTQSKITINIERECSATTKTTLDSDFSILFPTNPANAMIKIVDNNARAQVASGGTTPVVAHQNDAWNEPGTGHTVSNGLSTWQAGDTHHPPTAVMA